MEVVVQKQCSGASSAQGWRKGARKHSPKPQPRKVGAWGRERDMVGSYVHYHERHHKPTNSQHSDTGFFAQAARKIRASTCCIPTFSKTNSWPTLQATQNFWAGNALHCNRRRSSTADVVYSMNALSNARTLLQSFYNGLFC